MYFSKSQNLSKNIYSSCLIEAPILFLLLFQNIAAYAVVITPDGEMEAFLKLENLLKRKNSYNSKDVKAKLADMESLKKFIQVNPSKVWIF